MLHRRPLLLTEQPPVQRTFENNKYVTAGDDMNKPPASIATITYKSATGRSAEIYKGIVPDFAEDALEHLYSNIYCTLKRWQLYDRLEDINTYVVKFEDQILAILLYRLKNRTAYVLNQQVTLAEQYIAEFCSSIFSTHHEVVNIKFYALDMPTLTEDFRYSHQELTSLRENVITLPKSEDELIKRMSAQVRKKTISAMKKFKRDNPNFQLEILTCDEITEGAVRSVAALAEKRMLSKRKSSYINDADVEKLTALAHKYGYITSIKVNGEICAANLSFRVGKRAFSEIVAHDPAFDAYSLGNQVQIISISHSIVMGAEEYWMRSGSESHKSQFLATERPLNSITVYASRKAAVYCWREYTTTSFEQLQRSIKHRLIKRSHGTSKISMKIRWVFDITRKARTLR